LNKTLLIIILTAINLISYSQNCVHCDLSKRFDISSTLIRNKTVDNYNYSCTVKIIIIEKSSQDSIQTISYLSNHFFDGVFIDCNRARSYQTMKNDTVLAMDNDYGDLIVADFNFDNKDDLALKRESGGNGGPIYYFYTQGANGNFLLDDFLSHEMKYFPTEINAKNKTLVTFVHAGSCWLAKHVYSYHYKTFKWHEKSHRLINVCEK
jgi:hypothetical protein